MEKLFFLFLFFFTKFCELSLPPSLGSNSYVADQLAPSFQVVDIDGNVLNYDSNNPSQSNCLPLVIFSLNSNDPFSMSMIQESSSLSGFLLHTPNNTHFLFTTYSETFSVSLIKTNIVNQMIKLNFSIDTQNQFLQRLHFINSTSIQKADSIVNLLQQWPSPINTIHFGQNQSTARLDCQYGWCSWPDEIVPTTLVAGSNCVVPNTQNYAILQLSDNCNISSAIQSIVSSSAAGVILVQKDSLPLTVPGLDSTDTDGVSQSITMISYESGNELFKLISQSPSQSINITLDYISSAGFFASIDHSGRFQEVGWEKSATLRMLSWHSEWLNYKHDLYKSLKSPSLVIPLTNDAVMADTFTVTNINIPSLDQIGMFKDLWIEFKLGCQGNMDKDCSVWDHCVTLQVQCNDQLGNEPGGGPNELGRWITPFKRRVGHWMTNITPLIPLIVGFQNCTFKVQTEYEIWLATANLRFTLSSENERPFSVLPLVWPNSQTNFDGPTYNQNRTLLFSVPLSTTKIILRAVITGHDGCEFLPTSHHFFVNGVEYNSSDIAYDQYMLAGTPLGCADKTKLGAVPNEHGTWYYGRNGWCDGLDVKPLLWEITNSVSFGNVNNITYSALSYDVGGGNPSSLGCGGYILMSSYLSFYTTEQTTNNKRRPNLLNKYPILQSN